jgi:elongation factor Ts
MGVTASEVNELRQKTGAGLMDCKKALTESNGDIEAAIDILRKKGQKVSALRAGKAASEGAAVALTTADGKTGIVIKLSSETDFVSKNEAFVKFANDIAKLAIDNQPADLEALKALPYEGLTIGEKVIEMVGKINENIQLTDYEKVTAPGVVAYNHAGNKIGVLVALSLPTDEAVASVGRDVAMQIAAMSPVSVDATSVDPTVIERELAIGREKALAEGKPENMVDKIAQGNLQKFYKENTLLAQQFVKDGSKTVDQALKAVNKDLAVTSFKRVALG